MAAWVTAIGVVVGSINASVFVLHSLALAFGVKKQQLLASMVNLTTTSSIVKP